MCLRNLWKLPKANSCKLVWNFFQINGGKHSNLSSEHRKKGTYLLMPPTSDPKHINLIGTANVDDPACGFGLWIITDSLLLTWSSSYSTKSLSTRIKWSRLSDLKNKFETYFSDFLKFFFKNQFSENLNYQ